VPSVPLVGAPDRFPRSVRALLLVVVVVFGFAFGGSARAALDVLSDPEVSGVPTAPVAVADVLPLATVGGQPTPVRVHPRLVTKARPGLALPAGSGSGRRIVYRQTGMHLWVVGADGTVVRDYAVTGRPGWPLVGTYHVFSKSPSTASPKYGVTFGWMVRFAHGHQLSIGFHDIPRRMGTGVPIQSESTLGAPVGHGGCVRQRTVDARWLYGWAQVGTTVVVLR